jgi:hypothetical protein
VVGPSRIMVGATGLLRFSPTWRRLRRTDHNPPRTDPAQRPRTDDAKAPYGVQIRDGACPASVSISWFRRFT